MAQIPTETQVTPNRVSHLRFDVDDQALIQPPYSLIRMGNEIARSPDSKVSDVRYLQNVGWELEPYQASLGFKRERSEAESGNQLPSLGMLTIAASHVEVPLFAKPTDLTGSGSGWYDSNLVSSGDIFIQKRVADGDSFEQRLSADQTSFASAEDPRGENVLMDRVAVGTANHNGAPIIFSFLAPSNLATAPHKFAHFLFNGPAGSGTKWKGRGKYQLDFYGDGKAILRELVRFDSAEADEWLPVHNFQYAPSYSVGGQAHRVEIRPIAAGKIGFAPYGAIIFDVQVDQASSYFAGPGTLGATITRKPSRTSVSAYVLSKTKTRSSVSPPVMQSAPVRVDTRRDQRIPFQISKLVYRTSGYIIDDPFSLDFHPVGLLSLTVALLGSIPSGTTLVPRLFRMDTGVEITAASSTADSATFTLPERLRNYQVRIDFTGTEETTPILEGYQVRMDALIETISPGEFETEATGIIPNALMSVSITGQEYDPSHESMRLHLEDLGADYPRLSVRGRMLAVLETEYDPADDTKRCILFRGHLTSNEGTSKGFGTSTGKFPDRNWKSYDLDFLGVWKRLSEALSSIRFDWHGPDPDAPVGADGIKPPFKATDAIRKMLAWAGFPTAMTDIPDLDIRLYPSTTNDLFVEPLTNVSDYIARIAHDYLAMWLTFDPNAGTYGKWTLLGTPTAPYTIAAAFVDVAASTSKLSHVLDSYPTDPPTTFIRKGSLKVGTRPLEANRLVVTGTGILAGAPPDLELMTQVLYNFASANFFGVASDHPLYPDPDHPDYIGYDVPLYVVDPTLQTPEAVNLVSRRVFDIACLSTRVMSFEAPLLLIDHEEEGKKRPLRFYDAVTVTRFGSDSTWLVRSVSPTYSKDGMQMALYELEAPREPFL